MSGLNLKYSSVVESEARMYGDIRKFLADENIDPHLSYHIILALSEAFTNAIIHGNKSNPDGSIHLNMTINDSEIIADIIDEGCGDPKLLKNRENDDLWQEGGRGLMLMETLTSDITYCKNADTGGLQISMRFDRTEKMAGKIKVEI